MDNSRRPDSRYGWSDDVRIREVGAPAESRHGYAADAFPQQGGVQDDSSRPQRRNRPFLPAWIFTGVLIGIGFLWIGGVLEDGSPPNYGYMVTVDPATGMPLQTQMPVQTKVPPLEMLRNLGYVAPFMLLIGVASASALLVIQGARKTRTL